MKSYMTLALLGLSLGCPNQATEPMPDEDGGTEDTADAGDTPGEGPTLINECAEDKIEACAYVPSVTASAGGFKTGSIEISYEDVLGTTRTILVEVRQPDPAPTGPTPVVVWSHGGASGRNDPTTVGEEVGQVLNAAGYMAVMIAHTARERTSYLDLCDWLGQPEEECNAGMCDETTTCSRMGDGLIEPGSCFRDGDEASGVCGFFKHLNYDRPYDVRAVLDWLEEQNVSGNAAGLLDLDRIAYAGHSAGGGAAMMVAGATRSYAGVPTLLADARPVAFVSASPQGPGEEDFEVDSFNGEGCEALASDDDFPCMSRPHLVMTGEGDVTSEHFPETRRQSYENLPAGNKYMAYLLEERADHNTFQLKPQACSAGTERCLEIQSALGGILQAFLDAHLRDASSAHDYLASGNAELLLSPDLELYRK